MILTVKIKKRRYFTFSGDLLLPEIISPFKNNCITVYKSAKKIIPLLKN